MRARATSLLLWAAMASTAGVGAGCSAVATSPGTASAPAPSLVVGAAPSRDVPSAPVSPRLTPAATPTTSPGSPSPAPAASAPVSVPPVADPTPPAGLRTVTTAKGDGIRIRIELGRNPLVAGERNRVDVTVTNTGKGVLTWFHDGCEEPASVYGESLVTWDAGRQLAPQGQMFKQYALGTYNGQPLPIARIRFVPEGMLGKGSYGCADIGITDRVKPGASLRQTLWWTGFTDVNRALPPTGPLRIAATAGYYWHGTKEPDSIADQAYELSLDAWVVGGTGAGPLSPAQVVDAAVADPGFAAFLETQALANGREEIAWYDAGTDSWEVGIMPWYETVPPRIHGVRVDGDTGRILGPLDRPWDEDVDGFP